MDFADAGAAERALNEMNGHKFFDHVSRMVMMMLVMILLTRSVSIGDQAQLGTAIQTGYWQ